ncbi:DNA-binding transcriptional regulator, LysR family [Bartonella apihabitans]|uniref:LysR substrate-binding domain-containing protein n=1 Tax=Bartonella apihabitans TaxID=2750929 RepID=UPI00098EBA32|nr:LysR substrate-binding domain-containing protein [Bartonella apihabitans]AQT44143.1 DNA-binding transcriptional regulator, LysR family [Bartonella apihabitans]
MNQRRLTPSMSLLLAFEAAARHESYTRAAEELALTQSAVSRQVQALELMINVKLFEKRGRQIVLTDAGQLYKRELETALSSIRSATLKTIAFASGAGTLRLTVLPTFGAKWLLPKLNSFYQQHTNISLHIQSSITPVDFQRSQTDVAISVGVGYWPDVICDYLMDEELVVIGRPEDFKFNKNTQPNVVTHFTLLNIINNKDSWTSWFEKHDLQIRTMRRGPDFELTSHLIQAVKAGIGIGLVPKILVEDELAAGELVSPFQPMKSKRNYYLVYPEHNAHLPSLIQFREWLLSHI